MIGIILVPIAALATPPEELRTNKAATYVCSSNKECIDLVSMQLDGMYYEGRNEMDKASIGTLINRKSRSLKTFCDHAEDIKVCETYRNKLMLNYITGLLDR